MQQQQLPFAHHHTFLSPHGTLDDPPFMSNLLTIPLNLLASHPSCPAQLTQVHRLGEFSNIILTTATVLNRHTIQVFLHDARTDRLSIYKEYNYQNDRISGICSDPLLPNFFFAITAGGAFVEFDLFTTAQLLPKSFIGNSKIRNATAICTNGLIIAIGVGSSIFIYDRRTGKQIAVDRSMHQSDITAIALHPQHQRFLFSADETGMINAFELPIIINSNNNIPSMSWNGSNQLDECYIGTVQLTNGVEEIQFFGPDQNNYRFIAALSPTTSQFCLISFDCLDEASVFEVVQSDMRKLINDALIATFKCDPALFYQEYTDDIAENNLTAGFTIEANPNEGKMVMLDDDSGMGSFDINDTSETSSITSTKTTNTEHSIEDEIDGMNNNNNTQHQQTTMSPTDLFKSLTSPQPNDNINNLNDTTKTTNDEANHPRLWRVTNILSSHYFPDFSAPLIDPTTQQPITPPNQLFIIATTAGGGVIIAIINTVNNPNDNKNHIVITKLIPSVAPYTAHETSIDSAKIILTPQTLARPILITGGRDGRLALFNTHAEHKKVEEQFPAIFAQIVQENSRIDDGPRKHKKTRRGGASGAKSTATAGTKTESNATTANLGTAKPNTAAGGKPRPNAGKKK